jgi:microcompartment protein CcmK/EutM
VERSRPITEDDVLMTELLLARSFGNLKRSVAREASRSIRSVGGAVRQHPYAVAGGAIGAGIILYGLFRLLTRGSSAGRSAAGSTETASRPNMKMEIISMILPLVTPYITAYVEQAMGRMLSRRRG